MLKPIETRYNGHRFRSRLEARWAVFFDVLGVPYSYEPEGYTFEDYAYLPDFWIPSWDAFVEIKAIRPTDQEMLRYVAFAEHSGKHLLLLYGNPSPDEHYVVWCSPYGSRIDYLRLAWCRSECGQLFVENEDWGIQGIGPITDHDCLEYPAQFHDRWPLIGSAARDAFDAASSARFEFGEAGVKPQ